MKKLLQSYGMKYYIAEKEADHVCGQLVNTYYKDGCLSDDMDMFVYGCHRVIRNLDIDKFFLSHSYERVMPGDEYFEIQTRIYNMEDKITLLVKQLQQLELRKQP